MPRVPTPSCPPPAPGPASAPYHLGLWGTISIWFHTPSVLASAVSGMANLTMTEISGHQEADRESVCLSPFIPWGTGAKHVPGFTRPAFGYKPASQMTQQTRGPPGHAAPSRGTAWTPLLLLSLGRRKWAPPNLSSPSLRNEGTTP